MHRCSGPGKWGGAFSSAPFRYLVEVDLRTRGQAHSLFLTTRRQLQSRASACLGYAVAVFP